MLDPGLLELKGARSETKYTNLATVKFFSGLQTQRSPFAGIDSRYGTQFMGGRPDALIDGFNCEVSNKLTLQRRPGLTAYGVSVIPPPLTFYEWERVVPFSLTLMVDTLNAVYNYSTTNAGIYYQKSPYAGQTNFLDLVNTLYAYDGVDAYKITGPNILTWSNDMRQIPWTKTGGVTVGVPSFTDPVGGATAQEITWSGTGSGISISQSVTPNVTPVGSNTFTYSVWLKQLSTVIGLTLILKDQGGNILASELISPATTTWQKFQVTGTTLNTSTSIVAYLSTPTVNSPTLVYGSQLEVGGPASPTQITTTKPQGVYNTGIVGPTTRPTTSVTASLGQWQPGHLYGIGNIIIDTNGNTQEATTNPNGTTGLSGPTWATTIGLTTGPDGTETWLMIPPVYLSASVGYQYYYAFYNSATGQVSNVSPISLPTGPLSGNQLTIVGSRSTDPQVDMIAIYRNVDGGAFYYQLATIANPLVSTWSYVDTVQDINLNTSIYAPIGLLNTPPPAGALDPVYHASRPWVHSGSNLYYAAGPDNAIALNIILNAVPAESWPPLNVIPLDAPITRKISTPAGLLVWTVQDLWLISGTNLSNFDPTKILIGHGLRSWNALDVDGSTMYAYLADREFVSINPSTGSMEMGFPIGDVLEVFNPTQAYVSRHVSGSQDNAVFVADGSTGWYRCNPNQVGASLSGEQSPVWSPKANITNGCGAIASVETSPGVHQLLVGQTAPGVVLTRDITQFQDNGTGYTWSATIGSIVLTTAGTLAETESFTTEMVAVGQTASVAVLLDEIAGTFEPLPQGVNDPPQLPTSESVYSNRYYLSQGTEPPICRHLQVQLSGVAANTKDELLSLMIRGVLVPEQV